MDKQKYNNYPLAISQILGLIEANDIAIPEIQRPFVWRKSQVRDLMDSLYKGYPTGYIIIWKNPSVKLKNGSLSDVKTSGKNEITIRGIGYLVWRLGINLFKGKFYHNETIVPVKPIFFHSSAMRRSALRLTSSERLKRANASSYVTFFTSILLLNLTFLPAKIKIIIETTK